jgi:alpha-N-acetylglucosaminidase
MRMGTTLALAWGGTAAAATAVTFPPHLVGSPSAVTELIERVLPGSSRRFELSIAPTCPGVKEGRACFTLADSSDGTKTVITGTSASELTGGLGVYLREYCNMTIGWERGGGSRKFTPSPWPRIGATAVSRPRSVPYSHVTQVCTHSYTLVWHDWPAWEVFIDWMALAGHNSIVAPTGQEEVLYKVLTEQFGVADMEVRNWTNGPAFLTWSRGQNSHGNSIAGPLPRSFMKGQWALQRQILARYRDLGIAGHQPAFAGYAPWALAVRQNDTEVTPATPYPATRGVQGAVDTAWLDGRDSLFTRVADAWMSQVRGTPL